MSDKWPADLAILANDKASTEEREKKAGQLWETLNDDKLAKREHSNETLQALRALIEECTKDIRSHPDTPKGLPPASQSVLLQKLLGLWFGATKDKI